MAKASKDPQAGGVQSIEDLIKASEGYIKEGTAQAKFAEKADELAKKDLEIAIKAQADDMGLPYVHLVGFPISPDAIKLIDEETAARLSTVAFYYDGERIRVGTTAPSEEVEAVVKELKEEHYCDAKLFLISETSFKYAMQIYRALPKIREFIRGVKITASDLEKYSDSFDNFSAIQDAVKRANISEIVTMLISAAIQMNASDIHIEAEEADVKVRFRIDGVLHDAAFIEKKRWPKIISRMKLLARVKINITDKPQDGRYTIYLADENDRIDVRSSFLPTAFGESVVMRLLLSKSVRLAFEDLGLSPASFAILEQEIKKPNGMVLTTGPTGSGKTTTLYAVLNRINVQGTKIVTLEDPIEYQLVGIAQSQVDNAKGYTFAKGLRSILRQDPDVVMIGEIRDLETAEISIQAALTGHLLLSTLHTNDASGVIPRLLDMGVKHFFIAPAINALIGQRLVRKLCPHCRVPHNPQGEEKELIGRILAVISPKSGIEIPTDYSVLYKQGPGCKHCKGIGYAGRIGIYEIFTMTHPIKELAAANAPSFKILEQAIEDGMVTMLQDGVLKCFAGVTSFDEVARVIGKFDYIEALYDIVVSKTLSRGIRITDGITTRCEIFARDLEEGGKILVKSPMTELLQSVMAGAIAASAGDVHIEPTDLAAKIRYRIEGVLYDAADFSREQYLQLFAQLKLACGFPTNVRQASWDGRFGVSFTQGRIDCRVSIISGGYGETAVIRLLNKQATALDMKLLGMRTHVLSQVEAAMQRTRGMIITTGPTGSGKTTTLYSMLKSINKPDIKIITVEDPIEYQMDGIIQTQISSDEGYTFAAALRSLLRQNPNIIMIGEIRDEETAKIAVESSLTGHLVFSTVHANTAAGAIARLAGLGVERQLLASSLECSIGQRLVRTLCPDCKQEAKVQAAIMKKIEMSIEALKGNPHVKTPDKLIFYTSKGCAKCGQLGYRGRIGLFEVIAMDEDMQKIIQAPNVTDGEIEKGAARAGTIFMLQDGILKALSGDTSVEEVFRVAG